MQTTYLLVHGAWQGAWVWKKVIAELERQGARAVAIDLPGSGADNTPLSDVTLDAYAQAIVSAAKQLPAGEIHLVGHSMGGAAVTAATYLAPALFKRVVYLCAFLPREGESVAGLGKEGYEMGLGGPKVEVILNGVATRLLPEHITHTFLNDCTPEVIAEALPQFKPQALKPVTSAVKWSDAVQAMPKDYIVCTRDHAISPTLQELMAKRADVRSIQHLDSSHEPFLSNPTAVAELLLNEPGSH